MAQSTHITHHPHHTSTNTTHTTHHTHCKHAQHPGGFQPILLTQGKHPTAAKAPKDGKALAKARYAGDPAPWYVAGAIAVTVGLRAMVASKL